MRSLPSLLALTAVILAGLSLGCSGSQETYFQLKGANLGATNPATFSSFTTDLNSAKDSQLVPVSGALSTWTSAQGDSFGSLSGTEPRVTATGSVVSFEAADAMTATGRFPAHLSKQFTFMFAGQFAQAGFSFRFGSDDVTESMTIAKTAASTITATHSTSSGNSRTRSWSTYPTDGLNHILAFTFGETTKDIEFYVDGFRQSVFTSSGTGSASSFQSIGRDFKIANTGSQTFQLGQMLVFNQKLGPQAIYTASRFVGQNWNVAISTTVTREIRDNIIPAAEPENINATYIMSAILTPKCVSCHKTGAGYTPVFETETLLRAALGTDGLKIVIPGSSATSGLFKSVDDNSMPFGASPLSNTEKQLIKDWIDAGAP